MNRMRAGYDADGAVRRGVCGDSARGDVDAEGGYAKCERGSRHHSCEWEDLCHWGRNTWFV